MANPVAARRALVVVLREHSYLNYEELKEKLFEEMGKTIDTKYIYFHDVLDEAIDLDILDYDDKGFFLYGSNPGYARDEQLEMT